MVSAYVKTHPKNKNFFCYAAGPAKKIFKRKGLAFKILKKNSSILKIIKRPSKFSALLTGSSWASPIETEFRIAAKQELIKTIVYLDHWVDYRERFGYPKMKWQDNLPDEIWVGDSHALKLAKRYFKIPVKLENNLYFKEIIEDYKTKKSNSADHRAVLFIGEPISQALNIFNDKGRPKFGEKDILRELFWILNRGSFFKTVIIRFHPAEDRRKYDDIINKFSKRIRVIKSTNKMISDDLVRSDIVLGMSSMALAISFLCGKKTISVMRRPLPPCVIPYKITKLRHLGDLV